MWRVLTGYFDGAVTKPTVFTKGALVQESSMMTAAMKVMMITKYR